MFDSVKELISFIESQRRLQPKVSLARFKKICELYNNPQEGLKYIHVGGTNGKGSTVSYIQNILRNANYNVATYISPYVIRFNERISYNGSYIDDQTLLDIGNYIIGNYPKLEENDLDKLSFFEFVTLLAFIYFSRLEDLDFVVLEVGLGGLLDVTNIVQPLVSIITNVNYDHMNVLGNTLTEIAYNKLGIVKEGIPLVTIKNKEILEQVLATTTKSKSKLILVEKENIKDVNISLDKTTFSYLQFKNIELSLLGEHQTENAALAIEAIKVLKQIYNYKIDYKDIYEGLFITKCPGRLEIVNRNPAIILDGAHNIDGIYRLSKFINQVKKDMFVKVIFAVSANKQKEQMIEILEEVADEIVFSSFHYKRSDLAENLLELSEHSNKRVEADLNKLVEEVKKDKGKLVVFCGSLYFVSEVFLIFQESR